MFKILTTTLLIVCALQGKAQNWDINLLKPINQHETDLKNVYLKGCAATTNLLSIGVPLTMGIIGHYKHNKVLVRDGLFMGGSFLLSTIVTQAAKRIVDRRRPFETYSFIIKRGDESAEHSMPSGHTSAAFCTATSLSLRYRRWYIVVPAYLYAGSVGWARMYQGVHYPSDILIGSLVGAGSAWVGYHLQKRWERKQESKKSVTL